MIKSISIQQGVNATEILICQGILQEPSFIAALQSLAQRFAAIIDETVAHLFRQELLETGLSITIFTFPSGEKSKTREMKQLLEDQLLEAGFGRECAIIAMGGGVTTDLGGFLAATFCRGVPLISIPTTLLAMVDASIGGKCAVNTPFGKNLIGAFHFPKYVAIDPNKLHSLPEHERRSGMAEVIKYGLTLDPAILEESDFQKIIFQSCKLKAEILESDWQESGRRRLLNFGHTAGHALELLAGYKLMHGDAVAMGMLLESLMSVELEYLSEKSFLRVFETIQKQRFPLRMPRGVTAVKLMDAMRHDKKGTEGVPRFVVLKEIGEVAAFSENYCKEVEFQILEKSLQRYEQFIIHKQLEKSGI